MILWFIFTAMTLVTMAVLARPLLQHRTRTAGSDADVYRAQLLEIQRDEASGTISSEDAAMARTEVQRRLLGASESSAQQGGASMTLTDRTALIATAALLAIGSAAIYAAVGAPTLASADRAGSSATGASNSRTAAIPNGSPNGDVGSVDDMITRLETRLKNEPTDVEGWRMLGWSKYRTDDFAGAARAYAEAVQLAPDDAETQSAYGETLARVANGLVTVEAEAALRAALKFNPADPRARFLMGLKLEQDGNAKAALNAWLTMLNEAEVGADWYDEVRGRVVELSESSGIDVSARLPSPRSAVDATVTPRPGPSESDVAAADGMALEDRQAMIEGMVARLDQRLMADPSDLDGWLRLIRARRVLGQDDAVSRAVESARRAFNGDAKALQQIADAQSRPLEAGAN